MAEMERWARQLPSGFALQWTSQSLQERESGAQAPWLRLLSMLVVFLVLAALYESWSIPLAVMLVVPLGLLGAVAAVLLRGMPNDVFFKVGMITVIGLSAKNAILIVEFARQLQQQGRGLAEAALEAARLRRRPIVMTSRAFGVGVLPGAGASVAAAVAYSQEKRIIEAKDPNAKFGKGDMRGLVAPEAAATASAIGSFVPMLTLGVPGSGTTAVMMGALTLYNITPGPVLFETKPELVWGLIASLFVANVLLFIMNVPLVRFFSKVLSVPGWLMVPGILCISYIGVYAINAGTFDLLLVAGIGALGYFLRKFGVPMAPLVLGVVLGNMMEQNLRRALSMTDGDVGVLFASPVSMSLCAGAAAVVVVPQLLRRLRRARKVAAGPA
ncbi:hypothetical protein G6F68_010295 [Rhizopus microsporus]|nr:hypothetical protein G6F68_010295 [Rhizopus microsporus]